MKVTTKQLNRAKRVVNLLNDIKDTKEQSIANSLALLHNMKQNGLDSSFRNKREEQLQRSMALLHLSKSRNIFRYDVFRKAGFLPEENNLSDALASIFDPKEMHGLGVMPLKKLIQVVQKKCKRGENSITNELIEANKNRISVTREKIEEGTRPDIEIVCPDFIIFIENKMFGGQETKSSDGEWQTDRQWIALKAKCIRYSLHAHRRGIGVLLSPDGHVPKSNNFISITVDELTEPIKFALSKEPRRQEIYSLLAFLDFYSWNGIRGKMT